MRHLRYRSKIQAQKSLCSIYIFKHSFESCFIKHFHPYILTITHLMRSGVETSTYSICCLDISSKLKHCCLDQRRKLLRFLKGRNLTSFRKFTELTRVMRHHFMFIQAVNHSWEKGGALVGRPENWTGAPVYSFVSFHIYWREVLVMLLFESFILSCKETQYCHCFVRIHMGGIVALFSSVIQLG